mmetsp:Transcript_16451/g.32903  ORF Transcript_16451/g.32903 Transcript_16451/m.32903 type:complete len:473 (+) Transcript_16451:60-1478(+)
MSRETTTIIPPLAPIAETELVDAILHDVVATAAPTEAEADAAHPTEDVDPPSKSSPPLLPPFPSSSSPPPKAPRDDDDDDAIRDEIDASSPRKAADLQRDERPAPPPNSDSPPPGRRTRKRRTEFTASQKLKILAELDDDPDGHHGHHGPRPTIRSITRKYDVSKSSLFRWKARYRNRGPQDGAPAMAGRGEGKRLRRDDRFAEIKARLRRFVAQGREDDSATETGRAVWHATMLQERARRYRDEMLERHDRGESRLDEETVKALRGFKASKAWIRKVVREWEEEGNGDGGNGNGTWNVDEDDVDAEVEVEVEVSKNGGFDGVESGEISGDGVFDDDHVHEIDVETIIDGVTPDTLYHHHYQHGHDAPHYDQRHLQYDRNHFDLSQPPHDNPHRHYDSHHDQNHPHIAVMKEDEPRAHPYPDGVMRDYAKEMAEEAVDATMKLIGDMGNTINVNGEKVGAWFPSREDHDDMS